MSVPLANWLLALSAAPAGAVLAKATVALVVVLLTVRCAGRLSAAVRHRLLCAGFAVLLLLPIAVELTPPLWLNLRVSGLDEAGATVRPPKIEQATTIPTEGRAIPVPVPPQRRPPDLQAILLALWGMGALVFALPIAAGLAEVRRLRRAARRWNAGETVLGELTRQASAGTAVMLHDGLGGPLSCGARRPAIVLPGTAARWSAGDLDRVLRHEFEHVRRHDAISHVLARLACALYWFHPLAWVAWRGLRLEAERACDDAVLRHGDALAYADQLLALARTLSGKRRQPLLAMANRGDLAVRVRSLFEGGSRGRAGRRSALAAGAMAVLLLVALGPLHLAAGLTQQVHYPTPDQPVSTPRLEFDVISIKPAPPGQRNGGVQPTPGYQGYICDNTPLLADMTVAYGVTAHQIQGGPGWIRTQQWDIEAKSDQPHTVDELHLMLEHALEDRFSMKLHHETRQESVLSLEVDPHGAKLKAHEPADDTHSPPISIDPGSQPNTELFSGTNVSMTYLAFALSHLQSTPVLDRTGLDGHYDISVEFQMPRPIHGEGGVHGPLDLDWSALFDAIREQLGLQLVRGGKGPVDHIVIDSVQKPSAN